MKIKKVLIPTDFSEASLKALDYAILLEEKFDAEIHIAHVMLDESNVNAFYMLKQTVYEFMDELEAAVNVNMEEFMKTTLDKVSKKAVLKGIPHTEILRYASENDIDLIVIGSYEKTSLEYILYGSTTEKIIKKSKCPVLVVKI